MLQNRILLYLFLINGEMANSDLSEHLSCKKCFIYKDGNIYYFWRRYLLKIVGSEKVITIFTLQHITQKELFILQSNPSSGARLMKQISLGIILKCKSN